MSSLNGEWCNEEEKSVNNWFSPCILENMNTMIITETKSHERVNKIILAENNWNIPAEVF